MQERQERPPPPYVYVLLFIILLLFSMQLSTDDCLSYFPYFLINI